jgi:hypothetical protein
MSSPDSDSILQALRQLPSPVPSPELDERVRAGARRALEGGRGGRARSPRPLIARFAVPVVLAGTSCVYLACALRVASALYR